MFELCVRVELFLPLGKLVNERRRHSTHFSLNLNPQNTVFLFSLFGNVFFVALESKGKEKGECKVLSGHIS